MSEVPQWTGLEAAVLRGALRMTILDFAAYLGVSARTVAYWESRGTAIRPTMRYQAVLDTALARADEVARSLFVTARGEEASTNRRQFLARAAAASIVAGGPQQASWAGVVQRAVLDAGREARREEGRASTPSLQELATLAALVTAASLASRHRELAALLPRAIGLAEHLATGDDVRALALRSEIQAVAAWSLIKADDTVAAMVAADRAITSADQAGDPLRLAAASRCMAEVHMRAGRYEDGSRTALIAALQLDGARLESPDSVHTIRGAALLSAAASSARRGDEREARAALNAAEGCAALLPDEQTHVGTVFGPTNVAIHRVAVAVELGDGRRALDHVLALRLEGLPPALAERRARCLIDVSRAHALDADASGALDALLQAEAASPDETRTHRQTRGVVQWLLARPRVAPEVRALAARCGVAA